MTRKRLGEETVSLYRWGQELQENRRGKPKNTVAYLLRTTWFRVLPRAHRPFEL